MRFIVYFYLIFNVLHLNHDNRKDLQSIGLFFPLKVLTHLDFLVNLFSFLEKEKWILFV